MKSIEAFKAEIDAIDAEAALEAEVEEHNAFVEALCGPWFQYPALRPLRPDTGDCADESWPRISSVCYEAVVPEGRDECVDYGDCGGCADIETCQACSECEGCVGWDEEACEVNSLCQQLPACDGECRGDGRHVIFVLGRCP